MACWNCRGLGLAEPIKKIKCMRMTVCTRRSFLPPGDEARVWPARLPTTYATPKEQYLSFNLVSLYEAISLHVSDKMENTIRDFQMELQMAILGNLAIFCPNSKFGIGGPDSHTWVWPSSLSLLSGVFSSPNVIVVD